jgi:hypothetical protein
MIEDLWQYYQQKDWLEKRNPAFVFCMTKCRGESIRATSDVENNISIRATFPSSLLNIFANGSVWYILNPREVPE